MTMRSIGLLGGLVVLAVSAWTAAPAGAQTAGVEAAREYRGEHAHEILAGFAELLAIPNVARDTDAMARNAEHIAGLFRERGADMEVLALPGVPPLVTGEIRVPGATRTLGIYVHYDGQPVAADQWTHDPWEPVLYTAAMEDGGEPRPLPEAGEPIDPEWRIYARSAGDDKAPIPALLAALDALRESDIALTSNIRFMFDGEEEAGSPNLGAYLERWGERFQDVDVWLFADGPVHQSRRPLLAFGVRGITGMSVTVYGATRNLHSGHYGSWAPVPGQMLAELLATMKNDDGRVTVARFYDTVEPLGEAERAALDALPAYDEELMREMGLLWHEGPDGESLPERILLPSLTIRGMASGGVGDEARNIIPNTATAVLGMRLVKGNDPEHMHGLVEDHIRAQGYHVVREDPDMETRLRYPRIAKVVSEGGYPAARSSMELPVMQQIIAATRRASDDELVLLPSLGGTLPLGLFTDVMGKPAVIVPIANHDDNQHAPDENLRLANLWYGVDLYASLLTMPTGSGDR